MKKCKFKIGQVWEDGEGDKFEIVALIKGGVPYPVYTVSEKYTKPTLFTKSGKWIKGRKIPSTYDLKKLVETKMRQ